MVITVIIPVYQYDHISDLCHDLLAEEYPSKILIVDNGRKWSEDPDRRASGIEVVTPGWNLGWVGGINLGINVASRRPNSGFLVLNDDTRISRGFVRGLRAVREGIAPQAIVGPVYDDVWPHQHCGYFGPASKYVPKQEDRFVKFIDGTAMYIPRYIF